MLTDSELLAAYVAKRDQDALSTLLQRHLGLVYAAALRQVRDPGMAEDIVQGTFMALAAKAPSLESKAAILPAWLLAATRYAARSALRRRAVRTRHEQRVAVMETALPQIVDSEKLSFVLDEALNRLSPADRTAVALYYFENQSMRDVGSALAVSEDAAQMRVSRALVRLRKILQHMGIACPTDAFEESLHRCGAIAPPASLLAVVANSILHPTAASPGGTMVAQHLLQGLLIKKVAALALTAAVALAVTAPAVPLIYHAFSHSPKATILSSANATTVANAQAASSPGFVGFQTTYTVSNTPAAPSTSSSFIITLPSGISIELLGISDESTHQSWAPDGSPLQNSLQTTGQEYVNLNTNPNVIQRGLKWSARIKFPLKLMSNIEIQSSLNVGNGGAITETSDQNEVMITQLTAVPESKTTGTVRFDIATGSWQTVLASDGTQTVHGGINGVGNFTLGPAVNDKNNLSITLIRKNLQPNFDTDYTSWLVARTHNGKLVYPDGSHGFDNQTTYSFNISLDQIQTIEFQIKRFDLFVEFQNVSLYPGRHTNVQIDSNADIWQNIN